MADDTQPAITATDPRVAQILAMIQAKTAAPPVATDPSQSTAMVAPQAAPQAPQLPGVPQQPQIAPAGPIPTDPAVSTATIPQQPMPQQNSINPQPQPGPLKKFLQGLVSNLGTAAYAGTQGALQHLGLPTDYEKQQNAAHLAIAQQAANDTSAYRQSVTGLTQSKLDAAEAANQPTTIPTDDKYGAFSGMTLPTAAATPIMQRMEALQNAKDIAAGKVAGNQGVADTKAANALAVEQLKQVGGNPRDHQIRSVNGQIGLYSKRDGSLIKTLGGDTALITPVVRARANAAYAGAQVMDSDQNPTTVSRLTQLQTGAPTMTDKAVQTLSGDKLGAVTYLSANSRVEKNLLVLADPVQRGIIARATQEVDRNPGAIDSIINSSLQEGLSPQGADLIAAMKQMNEFGSTFKKYTGNGGSSTDSLRATIQSNQPSTANSLAVNQQLLQQDRALATGVLTNLSRPGKYTVPSKAPSAPSPASGGVIYAVDPQGVTHQAPAGTPLPPGWKAK